MNDPMHVSALGLGEARRLGGTTVLTDTQCSVRHRQAPPQGLPAPVRRRHRARLAAAMAAADAAVAVVLAFAVQDPGGLTEAVPSAPKPRPRAPWRFVLPTTPGSYTGPYPTGVPDSYAGVTAFTTATGAKPGVVLYYSGWREPFRARFATTVADHGAVPLVQIGPTEVSLAAVASGKHDGYLSAYAEPSAPTATRSS
jgi:hypothetical protein